MRDLHQFLLIRHKVTKHGGICQRPGIHHEGKRTLVMGRSGFRRSAGFLKSRVLQGLKGVMIRAVPVWLETQMDKWIQIGCGKDQKDQNSGNPPTHSDYNVGFLMRSVKWIEGSCTVVSHRY